MSQPTAAARDRAIGAPPAPKFGDLFENPVASIDNPHRVGRFVRVVRRPRGRINAGTWWQLTDGCGDFWEVQPENLRALADMPDMSAELDRLASVFTLREAAKRMQPDDAEHIERLLSQFRLLRGRAELCDRFHVDQGGQRTDPIPEIQTADDAMRHLYGGIHGLGAAREDGGHDR